MDAVAQSKIGRSVVIKGEVTAAEPLAIGGRIDGHVVVREHTLTVLEGAEVNAQVVGKTVIVHGNVVGGIQALERLELAQNSAVKGDISAPRLVMADGAVFNGRADVPKGK